MAGEALKVLDFLQIDEKLLSYSDLQTEADDLYTKHGFRTYLVPRYPIFYDLSDLGEAEYRKDVTKRIAELNTDGKPYIVVDLNLEKDLDFKGEVIASSWEGYTGSVTAADVKKDIELHAAANINYDGDKKLNSDEVFNGIGDFNFQLTPSGPTYSPDENFGLSNSPLKDVRSLGVEEIERNLASNSATFKQIRSHYTGRYNTIKDMQSIVNVWNIISRWSDFQEFWKPIASGQYRTDAEIQSLIKNLIESMSENNILARLDDDKADIMGLGNQYSGEKSLFLDENEELRKYFKVFYKDLQKKELETKSGGYWTRFDNYFNDFWVQEILNKINSKYSENIKLTKAELKAYLAQETGDFGAPNIIGIMNNKTEVKKDGYLGVYKKPTQHMGLCQLSSQNLVTGKPDADSPAGEAIQWLKDNGINFGTDPTDKIPTEMGTYKIPLGTLDKSGKENTDERTIFEAVSDPYWAIILSAAFMGKTMDKLFNPKDARSFLPKTGPKGIEMKNILFAAYNTGQEFMLDYNRDSKSLPINTKYKWFGNLENKHISGKDYLHQSVCTISRVNLRLSDRAKKDVKDIGCTQCENMMGGCK